MQPPSPKPSKDVAPFLKSLRQMLETESDAILRWTPDGRAFEIHDMEQMMARVLPKYFKHCKYTSFQRQLNYFNFRKWTKSKAVVCTFSNDCFLRDQPELAWRITRKKSMHVAHSAHNAHNAVHPHQHHQALHHHRHNGHRALPTTGPLAVGVLADRQFHAGAPPKYLPVGLAASPQHGAVLAQPPFWKRPRAVGPPPPTGAMRGIPLLDGGATGANGAVSSAMDALPVHDYDHRRGASRRYYGSPSSMPMSSLAPTAGAPLTDQGEPLDWIDCLLPPSDRVEDAMYSYMYSNAGAGAQLLGVPTDPSVSLGPPKFEYVSSLSM